MVSHTDWCFTENSTGNLGIFSNPLISKVIPIILRRAKQPFGQIEMTLRNFEAERKIVTQRKRITATVQKKNKKLKRPERKYFILHQTSVGYFPTVVQTKLPLML